MKQLGNFLLFLLFLFFNHLHGGGNGVSGHIFLCCSCCFSVVHTRYGVRLIRESGVMLNCEEKRIDFLFY